MTAVSHRRSRDHYQHFCKKLKSCILEEAPAAVSLLHVSVKENEGSSFLKIDDIFLLKYMASHLRGRKSSMPQSLI